MSYICFEKESITMQWETPREVSNTWALYMWSVQMIQLFPCDKHLRASNFTCMLACSYNFVVSFNFDLLVYEPSYLVPYSTPIIWFYSIFVWLHLLKAWKFFVNYQDFHLFVKRYKCSKVKDMNFGFSCEYLLNVALVRDSRVFVS